MTVSELDPRDPDDVAALQALLESAPDYTRRVTGHDPGPDDAHEVLTGLPPGLGRQDKMGLGLWADRPAGLVAFADVLRGWPRPGVAHIGLLVVHGQRRGQGLGRAMHDRVVEHLACWGEVDTLRLAIVATNAEAAQPFWELLGYRPTGEVKPYDSGAVSSSAAIWERRLTG